MQIDIDPTYVIKALEESNTHLQAENTMLKAVVAQQMDELNALRAEKEAQQPIEGL